GRCHVIEVDPTGVADPWNEAIENRLAADVEGAARLASRGSLRSLVVSIANKGAKELARAEFLKRSERLNRVLGKVAARLHKGLDSPGIVMTGGDVALSVMLALGTRSIQLGGELLPGIPLAWAVDGPLKGLRLVTKAGGFGPPEALAQATLALAM
ncbi:MAG TPA: nucleotide-binding domain containing protein, partial [bacterium]